MSKQTAVEWLVQQYEQSFTLDINNVMTSIIEQAKAMEREQIIDAFGIGAHYKSTSLIGYHSMADEYYNETYKGGEQ